MVAQGIEDTLSTSVRKVHVLVCECSSIFAGAKIEGGDKAKFIVNRQYPADHRLPMQGNVYPFRSFGRNTILLDPAPAAILGAEWRCAGIFRSGFDAQAVYRFVSLLRENKLKHRLYRPAIAEIAPDISGHDGEVRKAYG